MRRLPIALGIAALVVLALWFALDRPQPIALHDAAGSVVSDDFIAPAGIVYAVDDDARTLHARLVLERADGSQAIALPLSLGALEEPDAWRYVYERMPDALRGRDVRVRTIGIEVAGRPAVIRELRAARSDENALAVPVVSRWSYLCFVYLGALIGGVWLAIRPYGRPALDRMFALRAAAVGLIAVASGWTNDDLLRWSAPWGRQALTYGPARMYDLTLILDNPPLNPMLAAAETAAACLFRSSQSFFGATFIKAIPVLSLIALPFVIRALLIAAGVEVGRERFRRIVLASLCNPALIYDSALWGQTDVVVCTVLLASLCAYVSERPGLGTALFLGALLTKPQALAAAPLVAALVLWRPKPWPVVGAIAVALLAVLPSTVPHGGFAGGFAWLAGIYTYGANEYPWVSLGAGTLPALLDGSFGGRASDLTPIVFGISMGALSFAALCVAAPVLFVAAYRDRARLHGPLAIWYFAVSCMTLYWLSTRMHERYVAYAAIGAIVWAFARNNRPATVAAVTLSLALMLQMASYRLDIVPGVRLGDGLALIAPHEAYFVIYALLNVAGFAALLFSRREPIANPDSSVPAVSLQSA